MFDTKGFGIADTDVRIQISCDGICPFKLHKSSWSAWPVLASFLNLPPWLITKKFFTMLCLLIPGKSQVPFEYFDVWMRPLIDELKLLWEGVPAYDVLAPEGSRVFKLGGAVLYMTHDFPGYGTVSGAVHQGYVACPPCGDQLRGRYAYKTRKLTYRDARRWDRPDHFVRSPRFDNLFDGRSETRLAPVPKTPQQQRAALQEYTTYLARKKQGKRKRVKRNRSNVGVECDLGAAQAECSSRRSKPRKKRRTQTGSTEVQEETASASAAGEQSGENSRDNNSAPMRRRRPVEVDPSKIHGIKRSSIFYELPYWEVSSEPHVCFMDILIT